MAAFVVWWKRRQRRNVNKDHSISTSLGGRGLVTNPHFQPPRQPSPLWRDTAVRTTAGERRPRPQTVFERVPSSLGMHRSGSGGIDDYDTYDPSTSEAQRPRSATVYATTVPMASGHPVSSSHTDDIGHHSRTTLKLDGNNYVSDRRTLKLDGSNYVEGNV